MKNLREIDIPSLKAFLDPLKVYTNVILCLIINYLNYPLKEMRDIESMCLVAFTEENSSFMRLYNEIKKFLIKKFNQDETGSLKDLKAKWLGQFFILLC